jgi:hypothetical protein
VRRTTLAAVGIMLWPRPMELNVVGRLVRALRPNVSLAQESS